MSDRITPIETRTGKTTLARNEIEIAKHAVRISWLERNARRIWLVVSLIVVVLIFFFLLSR